MAGFAIRSRFAGHARRSAQTRHALRLKPDHPIGAGNQRMERVAWRSAWKHSYPTLAVANLPTLLFCAVGLGWIDVELALGAAQIFAVALLALIGARAGWVLDRSVLSAVLGAAFAGGAGLALAVLKFVIH